MDILESYDETLGEVTLHIRKEDLEELKHTLDYQPVIPVACFYGTTDVIQLSDTLRNLVANYNILQSYQIRVITSLRKIVDYNTRP